jgi:hypothetical protein
VVPFTPSLISGEIRSSYSFGTGSPKLKYDEWKGVKLIDEEININPDPFSDTLHDCFFETYWHWKKLRGEKSWKLDTYEE